MSILTEDRPQARELTSNPSPIRAAKTPSAFAPKAPKAAQRRGGRARSGLAAVAVVTAVVVGMLMLGGYVASQLFHPFKTVSVDRTPPPVMVALKDLSTFKAASGDYEVLVDTEKDVKYLPSWLAGERTLFVGMGSVDAVVDFRNLGPSTITVSPDRMGASIILPPATLEPANIDFNNSHVASRKRGLKERLTAPFVDDPTNDQPLYAAAAAKMDAAAAAGELQARAQANTTEMITRLLKGVGYTSVAVRYEGAPVTGPVSVISLAPSPSA
jgi:Protein of unknown function (DUF4230)